MNNLKSVLLICSRYRAFIKLCMYETNNVNVTLNVVKPECNALENPPQAQFHRSDFPNFEIHFDPNFF